MPVRELVLEMFTVAGCIESPKTYREFHPEISRLATLVPEGWHVDQFLDFPLMYPDKFHQLQVWNGLKTAFR